MTCEEIRLVKPTLELEKEALKYRQEHFDFGEQVINGSELFDKISSYSEWLEKVIANLYIAQVKEKYGIIERENYNKPKSENSKQPQCPAEKVEMIEEALRHFKMI